MYDPALSFAYTEEFPVESEAAQFARLKAGELGVTAISPATGTLLATLASAVSARSIAEVGTGTGVSGTWLASGMAEDGVLTSIDLEGEFQKIARQALTQAGIRPARARLIAGAALDVLPRLADAAYDLVFIDVEEDTAEIATEGWRILRDGGLLVIAGALAGGNVADPARRDPATVAMRELGRSLRETVPLTSLLPVGGGVLIAVKA